MRSKLLLKIYKKKLEILKFYSKNQSWKVWKAILEIATKFGTS